MWGPSNNPCVFPVCCNTDCKTSGLNFRLLDPLPCAPRRPCWTNPSGCSCPPRCPCDKTTIYFRCPPKPSPPSTCPDHLLNCCMSMEQVLKAVGPKCYDFRDVRPCCTKPNPILPYQIEGCCPAQWKCPRNSKEKERELFGY